MGDVIVRVADKETLDEIHDYLLDANPVYGFIEHNDTLSPTARVEYIGANKNYTPLALNTSTGAMSLNSWAEFPVIKANKPYMVKADGTPDYMLNEENYLLKEDGTESDVANTAYAGGAFSWLRKVYKKAYMAGGDRVVMFCMAPKDGFEPVGFKDPNDNELEGVWLPMFYGALVEGKLTSFAGLQPEINQTTAAQKTAIDAFSSRAAFLGGPIMETIIDLLIMFAKTTNLQAAYGMGNSSGYQEVSPYYGVKANAVVGGGQFYGTADGKTLNKIFHSIVLGSCQQYQRDPYELIVNGRVKVSTNYTYDLTGESYQDTGITAADADGGSWKYPHKYREVPGYGSVPVAPYNGSSATGGCDGLYINAAQSTLVAVCLRFCDCGNGAVAGLRARFWNYVAGFANWSIGASVLLLPPVGVAA
ncbi:MAG: hypothetical protein IJ353_04900 [Lachnospiraceae bacterium]|nr:hypothetical protein [Lachnospiraceae bacterium]